MRIFTLYPEKKVLLTESKRYAPNTNEFYFSDLATGVDGLSQQVIDLSTEPPTLGRVTADPPIYAPAGARYRKGLIYYSTAGGNTSLDGLTYRPGVVSFDPITKKSEVLVNNYYGYYFNTVRNHSLTQPPEETNSSRPTTLTSTKKVVSGLPTSSMAGMSASTPNGSS